MLLAIFLKYPTPKLLFRYATTSKKIFIKKRVIFNIQNIVFFYGLSFLIFLSLLLNFFLPLKYFSLPNNLSCE